MKTEEIMAMMQRAWDTESEQIFDAYRMGIASLLEELVAERDDLRTKLEQAEPVAEIGLDSNGDMVTQWSPDFNPSVGGKLYAAPVQPVREPLTEGDIQRAIAAWFSPSYEYNSSMETRMRAAIEAANGITKD